VSLDGTDVAVGSPVGAPAGSPAMECSLVELERSRNVIRCPLREQDVGDDGGKKWEDDVDAGCPFLGHVVWDPLYTSRKRNGVIGHENFKPIRSGSALHKVIVIVVQILMEFWKDSP